MAEVVQSNIEDTLPEVYELQQLGVLSPGEAKLVIKERTKFEYMMRRRISKKQDNIRFIEFELKLEKLKQSRISTLGLQDISEGARYRSLQRIHFLFQKCLKKNKNDIALWIRYIKYCKDVKSSRSLGLAFVEGLKHNPHCVIMWIMSAKNEMEANKNMAAARFIFLQGLKFNADSVHLWTEYFRLEVLHAEKLKKRQQIMNACDKSFDTDSSLNNSLMNYKTAKIVFKNALESIDISAENLSDFLNISKALDNGKCLIMFMFQSALHKYPQNSSIWVSMAEYVIETDKNSAVAILETAMKTLQNLNCLTDVINFIIKYQEHFENVQSCIENFCVNIENISISDPQLAITLASILIKNALNSLSHDMICIAQSKFTKNKSLWLFRIQNTSVIPLEDLEKALVEIPDDVDIWADYLALLATTDVSQCRQKWDSLINECFAGPLVTQYIEFVYNTCGFSEVCKVFHSLKNVHVMPEIAIKSMLQYQIASITDTGAICKIFDFLTTNYSTESNWQWYFKYCQKNCPDKLSTVLWKSKKFLSDSQIGCLI